MSMRSRTPHTAISNVARAWYVVDASSANLGRLSTVIARALIGKNKPTFSKHLDVGDFVIVVNSDKLQVTGDKLQAKMYYRHSGYPGGLKERRLEEQLTLDSRKVITAAVRGMLPKNKLVDARLMRLKVYKGAEHEHAAQQPKELELS